MWLFNKFSGFRSSVGIFPELKLAKESEGEKEDLRKRESVEISLSRDYPIMMVRRRILSAFIFLISKQKRERGLRDERYFSVKQ